MKKNNKSIIYKNVCCPICKTNDYELLNIREKTIETISFIFDFNNKEVCCLRCGLIYLNPMPCQESLNEYYSSKTLNIGLPDYNMQNRIQLIKNIITDKSKTVVEIGSNNGSFVNECKKFIDNIYGIDIGDSEESNEINTIKNESVDIFILNHVMEHLPDPMDYLNQLHSKLNNNGKIICEVPIIEKYLKVKNNALYHEHLLHFSENTLKLLFKIAGFKINMIEKKLISRPVGMILIAEKNGNHSIDIKKDNVSIKIFSNALAQEKSVQETQRLFVESQFSSTDGIIGVWGANEYADFILHCADSINLKRILIFDKSPKKYGTIFGTGGNKTQILNPLIYKKINKLSALIICAVSWKNEIRNELLNYGLSKNNIHVFPY
ncbi:MAG: hypothetical protein CMG74_10530 [Candidatus Marinimicrobia bacterium]|nr:hypothetical protein [Candidatus Neomarinimicrobiota bacterium]|tara:strand:- start:32325 stop:33461 length:1137 start_codon:yes stop_codon:yes gene_type:complete